MKINFMKQNSIIIKLQKHRLSQSYHVFWDILLILCFDSSEGKMVLHNSILKFNFEYIMIILRQYSKKNYRKIPKSSKIYIKCHILNCLGFNNYWILLHKINFHWKISMSVNIFPLEVFDFGVSRYSIMFAK